MSDKELRNLTREAMAEPSEENLAKLGAAYLRTVSDTPMPRWRVDFGWGGYGRFGQADTPEEALFHAFSEAAKYWRPDEGDDEIPRPYNDEIHWNIWGEYGYEETQAPEIDNDTLSFIFTEKWDLGVRSLKALMLVIDMPNLEQQALNIVNRLMQVDDDFEDWVVDAVYEGE